MIFATSAGNYLVNITDSFVNNIIVVGSVIVECVLFAWVFKAEKLIDFLNNQSKTLKIGKWWLILVKYIIPVLLSIIWIGGLYGIIINSSVDVLIILGVLSVILFVSSLVFTVLPAKSKDWFEIEERIE
jgi:NSS family neurotransmitter:Na+ symporter